ncbi:amidase family protein [Flavobacterium sp. ASW18X]|uniref:amidase family protein n=1 Tax=Flavobacterium sp. ASW18X TaxID=2572595 RepID=UPI0010ADC744|nr:amidase family protein [Flavobacterium sp. ASW18X]TKD58943.1 amidase [Flavobacterium sp. ASW18X]
MKYSTFGSLLMTVIFSCFLLSCKQDSNKENAENTILWEPYNDSLEVAANANHDNPRMRYKLIQSKVLDKNDVFRPLYQEAKAFSNERYLALEPYILEQDIPSIQSSIKQGKFTYEELVLFYLHRIYKYELDNGTTLNTIIALNASALEQARQLKSNADGEHPIYGMPILLKDNIGFKGLPTTAGAIALKDNTTADAFIVERLKEKGALILGKVNLSEWAYFFCDGCPVGYSAVGGQTLNPYGRRLFETGGSSSGSGTAIAAGYAVAAVGTETSGSILSPSSQNSVVGLKPTIGVLSRTGIVPISSTLDTPGPMTRNVTDNAILLAAMLGFDEADQHAIKDLFSAAQLLETPMSSIAQIRVGAITTLMQQDSIYKTRVEVLKSAGATIVPITPPEVKLDGFLSILNIDMKHDLPQYLETYAQQKDLVSVTSVADVVTYNIQHSTLRMPYGQARLEGILTDSTTIEELQTIKLNLEKEGRRFFDEALDNQDLDAILSINNYHAGYAAVAKYPAITIPMGYKTTGEPIGLTLIGKPLTEVSLLSIAKNFEQVMQARKIPELYSN